MKKRPLVFINNIDCYRFSLQVYPRRILSNKIGRYKTNGTAGMAQNKLNQKDVAGAIELLDNAVGKNKDLFDA